MFGALKFIVGYGLCMGTPNFLQSRVAVAPGNTSWILAPVSASSFLSAMVRFCTYPLLALYAVQLFGCEPNDRADVNSSALSSCV